MRYFDLYLSLLLKWVVYTLIGVVFIDLMFFDLRWKSSNNNYIGALVGREYLSGCSAAVPIRSKSQKEIIRAATFMVEQGPFYCVTALVSDSEAAIKSKKFRRFVKENFGTETYFLTSRSKSFLAESMSIKNSIFTPL